MNAADLIIGGIIAVVFFAILWRLIRKGGPGCSCGCGGCEADSGRPKVSTKGRKKEDYPYLWEMQIEGMTCRHCVRNVEDALNSLEGVWAKVDLGKKTAEVRLKQEKDEHELVKAVFDAGYAVSAVKKQAAT